VDGNAGRSGWKLPDCGRRGDCRDTSRWARRKKAASAERGAHFGFTGRHGNAVWTRKSFCGFDRRIADGAIFAGGCWIPPEDVSCRYQLNGLEKHPTENAPARKVRYGRVATGKLRVLGAVQNRRMRRIIPRRPSFYFRVLARMCGNPVWIRGLAVCGVNGRASGLSFRCERERLNRRKERTGAGPVAQRSAELLQKNKELEQISLTDPLTGTRKPALFSTKRSPPMKRKNVCDRIRGSGDARKAGAGATGADFCAGGHRPVQARERRDGATRPGDKLLQEVAKRIGSVIAAFGRPGAMGRGRVPAGMAGRRTARMPGLLCTPAYWKPVREPAV